MNTRHFAVAIAVFGLTVAAFAVPVRGQEYLWTWLKGADVVDQPGEYGELGVPASANTPGARVGSVSWIDAAGRLWLFGGGGRDRDGEDGYLNDLWRYDPAAGNWTWLKGAAVRGQAGEYGEIGVPASANTPGARAESVSWTDAAGRLWLFGGLGRDKDGELGYLNDLWRYDPATGNWTWMKGADVRGQAGEYGEIGVPGSANTPGARLGSVSWVDAAGNLWLFGGLGRDRDGAEGRLNDLWRYDPATGNWTWLKGAAVRGQAGEYGEIGVPASANTPGARLGSVSWTDNAGRLWLFGGWGLDKDGGLGDLNDLWRYDSSTGNWAWMKGSAVMDQVGEYGEIGVPASANTPGGREFSVSWTDAAGNLWLFGGGGFDKEGSNNLLNDLWRYDPATGNWTWMKGADVIDRPGEYGVIGVPAPANTPGARYGSVSWVDAAGNLWLFGGYGFARPAPSSWLNDLWRTSLTPLVDGGIWYLPAGGTMVEGVPFDTYILIANPGEEDAVVEIRYIGTDEEFGTVGVTVPAGTRHTENMRDFSPVGSDREDVAAIVRSINDVPIIVERAMYFPGGADSSDWTGSHNTIGLDGTGTEWFLAEGATHIFDQYVHVLNPGSAPAKVTVTFLNAEGEDFPVDRELGGRRVWTVRAEDVAGIQDQLSTRVTSDRPVAVDRTMYWPKAPGDWADGHASIGVTGFAPNWYLPEGATHLFAQYVLVVNPSTAQAAVEFVFTDQDVGQWTYQTVIGPLSRYTVNVGNVVDVVEQVSTRISSTVPVVAERAMYWPAGPAADWTGGHGTVGVPEPKTVWQLPEGATHIFDQYVLVANPSETETAAVDFTFRNDVGAEWTHNTDVGPGRRYTVKVNDVVGGEGQVWTTVEADIPVVAERAMYFPRGPADQWRTGHVTVGVGQ